MQLASTIISLFDIEPQSFEDRLSTVLEVRERVRELAIWLLTGKIGKEWLSKHGLEGFPESFREGGQGVVGFYPKVVVKVTSNQYEAELARRIMRANVRHVPRVFAVSPDIQVGDAKLTMIIMKRERPYASKYEKEAGEIVANYLDNNIGELQHDDTAEIVKRIVETIPVEMRKSPIIAAIYKIVNIVKEIAAKTGFGIHDTHGGNLGRVDNDLGLLDLGTYTSF